MRLVARGHGGTGARAAALLCVCCVGASVRPALAQDNPALRAAVQLAAEGRGDSARRIVAAELAKARPGDPAYVEALYWRGRLAVSGDSAERDLRRVAIEYSNSHWADQALLQLSQLALAAGNSTGALQLAERLRGDYPTSGLRGAAALWAGRAAFEQGDPVAACALLDSARSEAPGDVEFLNQVAFYRGRCATVAAAPKPDTAPPSGQGDSAARPAPAPAAPAHPAAPAAPRADSAPASRAPAFEVQVTATRSSRAAQATLDRLTRAGQHGRIVKGTDGILRVRAGPFQTEHEAATAAARLKTALGGHPFVVPAS